MEKLMLNSVSCSCCKSLLGILIEDMSPPLYQKFLINSTSVEFVP